VGYIVSCVVLIDLEHCHNQWAQRGFPDMITDMADEGIIGGSLKIDSLQNMITLQADLHAAWDNYKFGVDQNISPTF
jgi:hypothetical protein